MRMFVPGQGASLPYSGTQYPSSGVLTLKDGTRGQGVIPLGGGLVDVPAIFWDTNGRDMNDCLHSKLVEDDIPVESYRNYSVCNGYSANGDYLIYNGEWYVDTGKWTSYDCSLTSRAIRRTERDRQPIFISVHAYMGAYVTSAFPSGCRLMVNYGSSMGVYVVVTWADGVIPGPRRYIPGFTDSCYCNWSKKNGEIRLTVNTSPTAAVPGLARGTLLGSFPPSIEGIIFSDRREAATYLRGLAQVYIDYIAGLIVRHALNNRGSQSWWCSKLWQYSDAKLPEVSEKNFILEEPMLVRDNIPVTSNPLAGYWRNWLIQHAYVDACESVPVMSDNNISNIIEIVGFIKSLVVEHRIEIPRSLQDIWLSYRYSYSTTRSDVEEAVDFVHRYMDLGGLERSITCYGSAQCEFQGTEVTCRCRFDIAPREVGYLEKLWRTLYTYGLAPNFYVLWDSLPYSFMVDWFIPIGDMASVADAETIYCGDTYDISRVCFSLQYDLPGDGGYRYSQYSRWTSKPLKMFNELYWLDKPAARDRTLLFRVLDTASIFVR